MPEISYKAAIHKLLSSLKDTCDKLNPEAKSNTGSIVGRAFFWDEFAAYAKKQSDLAWEAIEAEEIIKKVETSGTHTLHESRSFIITDKVSEPRKTFQENVLAAALKKKYKVPEPITRELVGKAKIPGKATHTLSILERG